MVVIDATMLLLLLRPNIPVPDGPNGVRVDKAKERIEHLIQRLDKARTKIIVPTPALSEAPVRAGQYTSQQIIEYLQKYSAFRIEPFDTRAAVEVAAMSRAAIDGGDKRGGSNATWAKIKYDRQIVAIAKVAGATEIFTDDGDIAQMLDGSKITVTGLADLPLPPQDAQLKLNLTPEPPESPAPTGDAGAKAQASVQAQPKE